MKKIKLKWKKKFLDDKSGSWYAAKVPVLNWEYIVDDYDTSFTTYLFLGPKEEEEVNIASTKKFKTFEKAMEHCENHLTKTYKDFKKFAEKNTYENCN